MVKSALLVAAFLTVSEGAWAQQFPVGAGGQLQQIPPAPAVAPPPPDLRVDRNAAVPASPPGGAKIAVASLHITGATLFAPAQLIAASGFVAGRELDLAGLRTLSARISDFYQRHGYFLARAYVPEQDVSHGSVTVVVIEGRYGKIALDNRSRLANRVARGMLSGVERGAPVATAPLERRLLLLSDVPGVRVRSTLSPGAEVGTSDLTVDLTPGRGITGEVDGDNGGNRYTGAYRAGGTINFNDPTGHGDVLSLRALTSFDGLYYGRASYQAPIGKATVGIAYSHIHYALGREFKSLDASGNGDIAGVTASYPLIRSRTSNLYAVVGADARWFADKLGAIDTISHRRTQVINLGISGDEHDRFAGGGASNYSASVAFGHLDLRDAADRAADAASARANGSYGKFQFSLSRVQTIAGAVSAYGWVRGQVAFDNLDISEKIELGGAYAVRAYPEGETYGDQGYVATGEVRLLLPRFGGAVPGQFQLFGFVDVGAVDYARHPWFAGPNRANRSAYGAGVNWAVASNFTVKASYARKLGHEMATSAPDRPGRFWFQVTRFF